MGPQHSLQQLLMVIPVLGPCVGSFEGYSKDVEGMPADALLPRQPSLSFRMCEGAWSMHIHAVAQQ